MITLILVLFFSLTFPQKVNALDEFKIIENIDYNIDLQGHAQVNHNIELTNKISGVYAKEYIIHLNKLDLSRISATDQEGDILQKVENTTDKTNIYVKFNSPAIGKDKTQSFTLRYFITSFATQKGKLWEVSIPEFQNQNLINLNLSVPQDFGNLSFSSVNPTIQSQDHQNTILNYKLQTDSNRKILVAFGNSQIFDFSLTYVLNNPDSHDIQTEIAIPPDTSNQKITYTKIEPKPLNIKLDPDGNWMAKFLIPSKQVIEVKVNGQAKIFPSPLPLPKSYSLPSNLTQASKYWPTQDTSIQQIADQLDTPKSIYNYVVSTLSYDYNQINTAYRKGALAALSNPENSLCTEFTDLFVTLARAKNIPSREIEGFAYTNNPKIKPLNPNADILHAWPQYWDETQHNWISIDPTWGKTTNGIDYFKDLDLNHFAFVIHGQKSDYPPPPGSYRNGQNIKTIHVDFADKETNQGQSTPKIEFAKTKFGKPSILIIKNNSLQGINNFQISQPNTDWQYSQINLPPLSTIEVNPPTPNFIQSILPGSQNIKFNLIYNQNDQIQITTKYPPHYLNLAITAAILIACLSLGGIIITTRKNHD